jgi:multidrug resistance efflux pump
MVMSIVRKYRLWVGCAAGITVLGTLIAAYVLAHSPGRGLKDVETPQRSDERAANDNETPAVAVNPRCDPSLVISVQQLLSVEPFFVADLRAQVAGEVRYVQKDRGDPVKQGEMLIDVKVPDLEEQVREKEAIVAQRKQDLVVAQAQAENARALVDVYREMVEQRRAEYGGAIATRELSKFKLDRYQGLAKDNRLQDVLLKEAEKDFAAAQYAEMAAAAGVRKAQADVREKESALHVAEADIELKRDLIEVARKSRDRARAMLNYAQITAPFDGTIVKRNVNVGTFVQNASTGQGPSLLTIARTDIVTVVMKVPDNDAPFVTLGTEAIIKIDDLPDVMFRGKVTRVSPWIEAKDRTMRVEVDLYNDTPEKYNEFVAKEIAARVAVSAADSPLSLAPLLASTNAVCAQNSRSFRDALPTLPTVSGRSVAPQLIPGMTGYMRLNLRTFNDTYLIPSSAVYSRGGKPYITEVKDGVALQRPVRVEVNDGNLAKVSIIEKPELPAQGTAEVTSELTGAEVILISRQMEIADGQPVRVTLKKW